MPIGAGPPAAGPRARPRGLGISPERDGPAAGGQWEATVWGVGGASGMGASFLAWEMGLLHIPGIWVRVRGKGYNSRFLISAAPGVWVGGGSGVQSCVPRPYRQTSVEQLSV